MYGVCFQQRTEKVKPFETTKLNTLTDFQEIDHALGHGAGKQTSAVEIS